MKENSVPFVKYTSCGNNFVIVDETVKSVLSEAQKCSFAHFATSTFFGIGCDNLLVVQCCTPGVLNAIQKEKRYWSKIPSSNVADFVFRMFEPDGTEAFSCGNGLLSIASHIFRQYGIETARIMTEVPTPRPNVVTVGTLPDDDLSWANMGVVRRVPEDMVDVSIRKPVDDSLDLIEDITVRFRSDDLKAYADISSLETQGYLIFTGEPHLVIFPHESFSEPQLVDSLFAYPGALMRNSRVRRRVSIGSWLIRRIGLFLNEQLRNYFPNGINVNFAKVNRQLGSVEYRCFERGINRETLACGTGAVAVAAVSRRLGKLGEGVINVLPHLCRWHDPDARIQVSQKKGGDWYLEASPDLLVKGTFGFPASEVAPVEGTFDTAEMLSVELQLLRRRITA